MLTVQEAFEMGIVTLGINSKIQSGVMIGMDGFGFERDSDGILLKFPHNGKVSIGNDVEIHGPTVICRGSLDNTVIGHGTKIAGNVQIGHNSKIGNHVQIGPHTLVSGSAILEDFVTLHSYVLIEHGKTVGSNSEVGSFSYVRENIPSKELWYGIPAKKIKEWNTV